MATIAVSRRRSRGPTSARNAAGAAASRPSERGSASTLAPAAPIAVPAFQHTKTARPVAQNPSRPARGSSRAVAIAVLSSITRCAAPTRRSPLTRRSGASRTPYSAFLVPRSTAVATPALAAPPVPTTPTSANCDAPVNIASESVQVWAIEKPAAVEIAPNDSAYAPVATPMPTASRTTAARTAVHVSPAPPRLAPYGAMPAIGFDDFDALTFDCYGTLIDWESGHPRRPAAGARRARVDADDEELLEAFAGTRPRSRPARTCATATCSPARCAGSSPSYGVAPTDAEVGGVRRLGRRLAGVPGLGRRARPPRRALPARRHHELRRRPVRALARDASASTSTGS